jgi:hypothetical protein
VTGPGIVPSGLFAIKDRFFLPLLWANYFLIAPDVSLYGLTFTFINVDAFTVKKLDV